MSGPGEFVRAPAAPASVGDVHFTVEVESGLPLAPAATARTVDAVLRDARSWRGVTGTTFAATSGVDPTADLRILIATPTTTDRLCAPLLTRGRVSCRNGDLVVLNARRWAFGTPDYAGRVPAYRRYLVNHEVGHYLGQVHTYCPAPGRPAPVMMQQTYGLDGCTPNVWPGS